MAYVLPLDLVLVIHILGGSMGGKRELIEPHEGDKRYVRRDESGQFSETDNVGRSLSRDRDLEAQRTSESGQGDGGDRTRRDDSSSTKRSTKSGSSASGSMRGAAGRRNKGDSGMGGSNDGGNR